MVRPLDISAPGSLMLLGEHAVLHGHPCLVAAINRRVRVSMIPRSDDMVTMISALGEYEGDRDDLPDHPSFRFLIGAIRHLPDALPGGFDATIQADMSSTIGFGTSAAVTVAMIGALHHSKSGNWSLPDILDAARSVIRQVQGRGSGADAAASVYGGVIHYRSDQPGAETLLAHPVPLIAAYCGYKTPTPEVIRRVEQSWNGKTDEIRKLYALIGETVELGRAALLERNDKRFGQILDEGHTLMQQLGVSTRELDHCAELLRKQSHIFGAKISGSGLGDCVVGWGSAKSVSIPYETHHLTTAAEGIRIE